MRMIMTDYDRKNVVKDSVMVRRYFPLDSDWEGGMIIGNNRYKVEQQLEEAVADLAEWIRKDYETTESALERIETSKVEYESLDFARRILPESELENFDYCMSWGVPYAYRVDMGEDG